MVDIKWPINFSATITRLGMLSEAMPVIQKSAVKGIAEQILWMSDHVSPMVPEKTAALRSTGRVEKAEGGWAVVYGGRASDGTFVDYANQVHDDLRPRTYTRAGSGPKFVEAHYDYMAENGAPIIEKEIQAAVLTMFAGA